MTFCLRFCLFSTGNDNNDKSTNGASLLWLFKIRRLFALIAYFVMLLNKTPVIDATIEKRMMLQGTLESFVGMFELCVHSLNSSCDGSEESDTV